MDIQDLHMPIRIINPVHQCEVSNNGDMQEASCVVIVGGIRASDSILGNGGERRPDWLAEPGGKPLDELHLID